MQDIRKLNRTLLRHCDKYLTLWLPGGTVNQGFYRTKSFVGGRGSNLVVNMKTGYWKDHVTGVNGRELVALYGEIQGLSQIRAAALLKDVIEPLEQFIVNSYRWDKIKTHFRWKTAKEIVLEAGMEPSMRNFIVAGTIIRKLNGNIGRHCNIKKLLLMPKRIVPRKGTT